MLWIALAVLVAGFLAHRAIENGAVREAVRAARRVPTGNPMAQSRNPGNPAIADSTRLSSTDRAPAAMAQANPRASKPGPAAATEDITNRDRQALDRILKRTDR